jgi:large subunit ribosomal protein L28
MMLVDGYDSDAGGRLGPGRVHIAVAAGLAVLAMVLNARENLLRHHPWRRGATWWAIALVCGPLVALILGRWCWWGPGWSPAAGARRAGAGRRGCDRGRNASKVTRSYPARHEVTRPMAAVCEVCGKHPSWGMSVSHSHRRTKRRWNPNIQRVRVLVGGAPKRVSVCTGCIKSGKITKVAH